ncbi:sigma-70 family RNA polymerase sigma factor [Xanthomonas sp. 1678]|uniref:sigma-70 family RNA polymerase sigma factor n=1 Tax=Xanthomonas sp. 1678 TaxID=3158788 RepID=UPI002856F6AA|nr:RNA polymerase sigma-70 factor (ECF subfamily) [Xanthomonas translucens]
MSRLDALQAVEARLHLLFVAGLEGDARDYRAFLDELSAHLRGFLRRRLSHAPDDVEDVLQETLLAIHNSRHTYRRSEPLTAWVYAVARYKLLDFYRAHARKGPLQLPLTAADDLFAHADDAPAHARHEIGRLLEQLPDRHRLPIVHVKLQGLSVSETARLTGMSESAVKIGVHRGLKALALKIRSTT